ncbi:flocculation protein FLO11-like [Penaeus chinensis]|uniref:flocculation protein FLO11-like n=1 Tax=Penaeus chinensis TaxID=139456 RepID=UPI001FB5E764|nr:flocculation protein FLO11-like [Penaeus chinensis]
MYGPAHYTRRDGGEVKSVLHKENQVSWFFGGRHPKGLQLLLSDPRLPTLSSNFRCPIPDSTSNSNFRCPISDFHLLSSNFPHSDSDFPTSSSNFRCPISDFQLLSSNFPPTSAVRILRLPTSKLCSPVQLSAFQLLSSNFPPGPISDFQLLKLQLPNVRSPTSNFLLQLRSPTFPCPILTSNFKLPQLLTVQISASNFKPNFPLSDPDFQLKLQLSPVRSPTSNFKAPTFPVPNPTSQGGANSNFRVPIPTFPNSKLQLPLSNSAVPSPTSTSKSNSRPIPLPNFLSSNFRCPSPTPTSKLQLRVSNPRFQNSNANSVRSPLPTSSSNFASHPDFQLLSSKFRRPIPDFQLLKLQLPPSNLRLQLSSNFPAISDSILSNCPSDLRLPNSKLQLPLSPSPTSNF